MREALGRPRAKGAWGNRQTRCFRCCLPTPAPAAGCRRNELEKQLTSALKQFVEIAYVSEGEVDRLIDDEVLRTNQEALERRKTMAELHKRLQVGATAVGAVLVVVVVVVVVVLAAGGGCVVVSWLWIGASRQAAAQLVLFPAARPSVVWRRRVRGLGGRPCLPLLRFCRQRSCRCPRVPIRGCCCSPCFLHRAAGGRGGAGEAAAVPVGGGAGPLARASHPARGADVQRPGGEPRVLGPGGAAPDLCPGQEGKPNTHRERGSGREGGREGGWGRTAWGGQGLSPAWPTRTLLLHFPYWSAG